MMRGASMFDSAHEASSDLDSRPSLSQAEEIKLRKVGSVIVRADRRT